MSAWVYTVGYRYERIITEAVVFILTTRKIWRLVLTEPPAWIPIKPPGLVTDSKQTEPSAFSFSLKSDGRSAGPCAEKIIDLVHVLG